MKTKTLSLCLGFSLGLLFFANPAWSNFPTPKAPVSPAIAGDNQFFKNTLEFINLSLPPTVSITSPANGSFFTLGSVIQIAATATDASGFVVSVEFLVDNVSIGIDKTPPYEASYIFTGGSHQIVAKATDNDGMTGTDTISINGGAPGLEKIIVEKYYISNAADAAQADADIDQYNADNGTSLPHGALPPGSVTYRFYADMRPGYKLLTVYADGTLNQSLKFTTSTSFYNHPIGSFTPLPGTTKASLKNNLLALDTYFSLGGVAAGQYGILKTEDNGIGNNISSTSNPGGILLNNDTALGLPLTIQDGMIAGTGVVNPSAVGFSPEATAAFTDGTVISNTMNVIDGAVYTVTGAVGPVGATNKLLIAQVTTNGNLHYELNLLIQHIATGGAESYVSKNPRPTDLTLPSLAGDLLNDHVNQPPIVSITSPVNNANLLIGSAVHLTADAIDLDDTIQTVEFFADGNSIGMDSTAPYEASYLITAGDHILTAKATDQHAAQTLSNPVTVHAVASIPSVAITSPANNTTFNVNKSVQITATASDPLVSIDSVEFFVDGISIGADNTAPYAVPYLTTVGVHELTAKAANNIGVSATSSPVSITVLISDSTNGLERIYVEKYYIANAADAANADETSISYGIPVGALPAGSVTYRFYADLLPGYKLFALYADDAKNQRLQFKTTTSFYNHPLGTVTPVPGTSKADIQNNLLALDSYLSLGAVAISQFGIPKDDDDGTANNVTTTANPDSVLLNNLPGLGFPLTLRDGMITKPGIVNPSFLGFSQNAINAFSNGFTASNNMEVIGGSMLNISGASGPIQGSNKILIAQVTTNGILNYELNLLLNDPNGNGAFYAAHPTSTDRSAPGLSGTLDPNAQAYGIKTISGSCLDSTFSLPLLANDNVKNVIGYDMVLSYDTAKVHPTGVLTFTNNLIDPSYISYAVKDHPAAGEFNISVFLNANAPDNTTFQGKGELFRIGFIKDPAFSGVDTLPFHIVSLQESYATGVSNKTTDEGFFINAKNTLFTGSLQFWTDNSPIKNDPSDQSKYLPVRIYGADLTCQNKSSTFVQPNLAGNFTHDVKKGAAIQIERDIRPATDVQPVINGFDASLGHKVLVNDASFIPNIYQAIALDVNTDGVISAGDISQINQRSVKTISEFKQKWNYYTNGSSNGNASKDWLFIDDSLLLKPAYHISATYPADDGSGYSKFKVPMVPFCLKLPNPSNTPCPIYEQQAYTGILLGDVNGNYDAILADGHIKKTIDNGTIYLDLSNAISAKGYLDVPVSFIASQKIVSLDFAAKLNEAHLQFVQVITAASYLTDAMANVAGDDHTLRFTSNSAQHYHEGETVAVLRFSAVKQVLASDFISLTGYLNGEPTNMIINGNFTSGIFASSDKGSQVIAYPNPAANLLNILSTEKANMELTDLQGRQLIVTGLHANEKLEVTTDHLSNGTYILKVYNDHFLSNQLIVIEQK
jgi:hypothetical protein